MKSYWNLVWDLVAVDEIEDGLQIVIDLLDVHCSEFHEEVHGVGMLCH